MTLLLLIVLSLLWPIVPWIGLSPGLGVSKYNLYLLPVLAVSGLLLDLWWGKSLGGASLLLLLLVAITKITSKFWPTERQSLSIASGVFSLLAMEIYLYLS